MLPYEHFDEQKELFYNDDAFGFLLEVTPATNLSEENIRVIAGILGNNVPPQTNIQFLLYASPDVYPLLNRWYRARASRVARERRERDQGNHTHRIYAELARRRVEYLASGIWQSLFSDEAMMEGDYRVFVSAQRPLPDTGHPREADIEQLDRLRSGLIGTYQSVGLKTRTVTPELFINLMDALLNPRKLKVDSLRWQEDLELREQVVQRRTGRKHGMCAAMPCGSIHRPGPAGWVWT